MPSLRRAGTLALGRRDDSAHSPLAPAGFDRAFHLGVGCRLRASSQALPAPDRCIPPEQCAAGGEAGAAGAERIPVLVGVVASVLLARAASWSRGEQASKLAPISNPSTGISSVAFRQTKARAVAAHFGTIPIPSDSAALGRKRLASASHEEGLSPRLFSAGEFAA